MEINLIGGDEEIVIEDTPTPLTQEQIAAVEQAVSLAINSLDIRELIRDSVQDTLGGIKRRLRTGDKEQVKR